MSVALPDVPSIGRLRLARLASLSAATLLVSTATFAQGQNPLQPLPLPGPGPVYVIPGENQIATLYVDGSQIEVTTEQRWRFISGSDLTGLTVDDLAWYAESHLAELQNGPAVIIDSGRRSPGMDIVFSLGSSVPAEAEPSFATAEAYLEGVFGDEITVLISVSFANMGSGVLGATGPAYRSNETYNNSRNGLQSGMDSDDVIQGYLPPANSIPVRYNASSTTVSDENRIDWTKANYNATVGVLTGTAASMQFNTQFSWDYDPSNGVGGNKVSLVDVIVHEVGHVLGFVSAADDVGESMDSMDIFRFQRTDGDYDYNPDTYAEFQTTPRLVDYNNPNDQHISDLIDFEYRMEDGSPYQASHFRQASNHGIMCPAIGYGVTRYPDFFSSADRNMFDAIGFDYPPCEAPEFITQPEPSQTVCAGGYVALSVEVDTSFPDYQWRLGTTDLVDDGVHILGATSSTLTIVNVTEADEAGDYNCVVTDTLNGCPATSDNAQIIVDPAPVILEQPQDQAVTEGGYASFSINVESPVLYDFQWRKDTLPLSDNGHVSGALTQTLTIVPVEEADEGAYDCVVTGKLGTQCSVVSDAATLTVEPGGDDCPEDLNGDEYIGLGDLSALLANYGQTGMGPEDGDLNGDGVVDISDLSQLLGVYGLDCPTR